LQDLPQVLGTISEEEIPGIEEIVYDLFAPQPVNVNLSLSSKMCPYAKRYTDAYIYYFRRIMHNYPDPTCIEVLKNSALAMGPYSRLLIGEMEHRWVAT
jgi:hypothetical protein